MLNFRQVSRKLLEVPPETEKTSHISSHISFNLDFTKKMVRDELVCNCITFQNYLSHILRIFNNEDDRERYVLTLVNF